MQSLLIIAGVILILYIVGQYLRKSLTDYVENLKQEATGIIEKYVNEMKLEIRQLRSELASQFTDSFVAQSQPEMLLPAINAQNDSIPTQVNQSMQNVPLEQRLQMTDSRQLIGDSTR